MREEIRPYPRNPEYEVSNLGRVRTVGGKWRSVKARKDRGNYYYVSIKHPDGRRKNEAIHRMVTITFHGEPPAGHEVGHRDGVPTNNIATNLRWVTRSENVRDAIRHGTFMRLSGDANPRTHIPDAEIPIIRRRHARGETRTEIARDYATSPPYIGHIVAGRRRQHVQ